MSASRREAAWNGNRRNDREAYDVIKESSAAMRSNTIVSYAAPTSIVKTFAGLSKSTRDIGVLHFPLYAAEAFLNTTQDLVLILYNII